MRLRANLHQVGTLVALVALALGAPRAEAGKTTRISLGPGKLEADAGSFEAAPSASGRYVAFMSNASNLVSGDGAGIRDLFVRDRKQGMVSLVTVGLAGAAADGDSQSPSISANARLVAFRSQASNLVPGDANGASDIFVHDRKKGSTRRISVDSAGSEANGASSQLAIAANGRFVAFRSLASNLVAGDGNGIADIFVHDRKTGATERVSVSSTGIEANGLCSDPSISANGRYVAFSSSADTLVTGDTNSSADIFVRDRKKGTTRRVSVDSTGTAGNLSSSDCSISANGRFVAFFSAASNLVTGDGNAKGDVFVHDRHKKVTKRVSLSSKGAESNDESVDPRLTRNGRFVVYSSIATNLVAGDANGAEDVFLTDRKKGTTRRMSVHSSGAEANAGSSGAAVSANGRTVCFTSAATNLIANDTNAHFDVFAHDRK